MPIASIMQGMKDRGEAFHQIGAINKGAPKGARGEMGADLAHFRFSLEPGEEKADEVLKALYGDKPNHIRVRLPLPQVSKVWEFWLEAYIAGAMIARIGAHPTITDGREYIAYWRNPRTGEILVKNWMAEVDSDKLGVEAGEPVRYANGMPVWRYTNRKTNTPVDVLPKPVGRLQVLIPELRRLVYFVVKTGSWNDCINISRQLGALEVIQQLRGKHVAGVPLILSRVLDSISTPSGEGGARARRDKWLISIEPDPEWVEAHIASIDSDSRPMLLQIAKPLSETESAANARDEPEEEELIDEPQGAMEEIQDLVAAAESAEDPYGFMTDGADAERGRFCFHCGQAIEAHGIHGEGPDGSNCPGFLSNEPITAPATGKKEKPVAKPAAKQAATKKHPRARR